MASHSVPGRVGRWERRDGESGRVLRSKVLRSEKRGNREGAEVRRVKGFAPRDCQGCRIGLPTRTSAFRGSFAIAKGVALACRRGRRRSRGASRLPRVSHWIADEDVGVPGELRDCQGCRIGLPTRTSAFPGELRDCQGCRIGLPTRTSAFPGSFAIAKGVALACRRGRRRSRGASRFTRVSHWLADEAVGVPGVGITFCWVGLGGFGLVWLLS